MNEYVIITDSCVDLPAALAASLEINILPLTVMMEGKEYKNHLDESEIQTSLFYRKLREKIKTSTAQANPQDFVFLMEPFLEAGKDILSISFSSQLSGTYQSSVVAKTALVTKYPERKIVLIDSLCASMGQGLLVSLAAKMRLAKKAIEVVAEYIEGTKLQISHLFTVSDLGHLRRGGRLSAGKEILGTILNVKPLLHVSKEGKLVVYGKARGRYQSLNSLIGRLMETIVRNAPQTIFISHGDCLDDALYVQKILMEKLGLEEKDFLIHPIGPVIGSHSGADTLALFYIGSDR